MKITIDVTQQDIKCGAEKDCSHCPVALAAARVIIAPEVFVAHMRSLAGKPDDYITLPQVAKDFIKSFDYGLTVKPFSFEVDVPENVVRADRT